MIFPCFPGISGVRLGRETLVSSMVFLLVARAIRNAIRANRFARIIRNRKLNPYFYSASGRFARITRISDPGDNHPIRVNRANRFGRITPLRFSLLKSDRRKEIRANRANRFARITPLQWFSLRLSLLSKTPSGPSPS